MKTFKVFLLALMTLCGAACSHPYDEQKGVCVTIYNHTPLLIAEARINDKYIGNSNSAYGGGGGEYCGGPEFPARWHEGLKVTVKWTAAVASDYDGGIPEGETIWKEKVVAVPRYIQLNRVFVNFFPNDEVKVDIADKTGRNPYPDPVEPAGFVEPLNKGYDYYQCTHIKLPVDATINDCVKRHQHSRKTGEDILKGKK